MIKNESLDIKNILKIFRFSNRFLFYKILKNYFKKLLWEAIFLELFNKNNFLFLIPEKRFPKWVPNSS